MRTSLAGRAPGAGRSLGMAAIVYMLLASLALLAFTSLPTLSHAQATAAQPDPVPNNAEPACRDFLEALKNDNSLDACMKPLMNATSLYRNGSQSAAAAAQLTPTLQQLCSEASCDSTAIRKSLTDFWGACRNDIVNQLLGVYNTYDFLYILLPFKDAICSTDSNQNYCLLNVAKAASASSKRSTPDDEDEDDEDANDLNVTPTPEEVAQLQRRERDEYHANLMARMRTQNPAAPSFLRRQSTGSNDDDDNVIDGADDTNNGTDTNNVAFLFVKPDASKDILCSECVQNILAGYIKFEVSVPYAVGLSSSLFLRGQSDLYKAAQEKCGEDFTRKANQIAGTEVFAEVGAALPRTAAAAVLPVALSSFAAAAALALIL
ncbi:hypothetical protein V8E36_005874 [Tilletia maclaganii]